MNSHWQQANYELSTDGSTLWALFLGDDAQGEEQDRETASSIWISTFHNAGTI